MNLFHGIFLGIKANDGIIAKEHSFNSQAMDKLRQDAAKLSQEINCMEKLLLK